jgi:hypothetical protein
MTIRVTHIYRRIDGEWYLVHRHADFPPSDQRTAGSGHCRIRLRLMSAPGGQTDVLQADDDFRV